MTLLLITVRLWSRLGFDPRSRIISITYNDFHDEIRYNLYRGFQLCNYLTFLWSRIDYDFRSGFIMGFIVEIVLGRYHRRRGIGVPPTTPILIYFNKKEYMWLMTNWPTGEAKPVRTSRLLRIMTRSNKRPSSLLDRRDYQKRCPAWAVHNLQRLLGQNQIEPYPEVQTRIGYGSTDQGFFVTLDGVQ